MGKIQVPLVCKGKDSGSPLFLRGVGGI